MKCRLFCHLVLAAFLVTFPSASPASVEEPEASEIDDPIDYKAPYVTTPMEIVEQMLKLAKVTRDDVVYDLGSGDGRIVITAAKRYGARGVGLEIDPGLVEKARLNAKRAGVQDIVEFRLQDIFTADLSRATVVTLYLLPETNAILRPKLEQQLRPGARIVSHDFSMGDWKPDAVQEIPGPDGSLARLHLWRIPPR